MKKTVPPERKERKKIKKMIKCQKNQMNKPVLLERNEDLLTIKNKNSETGEQTGKENIGALIPKEQDEEVRQQKENEGN